MVFSSLHIWKLTDLSALPDLGLALAWSATVRLLGMQLTLLWKSILNLVVRELCKSGLVWRKPAGCDLLLLASYNWSSLRLGA